MFPLLCIQPSRPHGRAQRIICPRPWPWPPQGLLGIGLGMGYLMGKHPFPTICTLCSQLSNTGEPHRVINTHPNP